VPAQPVDATPSSQLICQYFPSGIDLYGKTLSESKQGFVLFGSTLVNEISLVSIIKGGCEQVLQRPIETATLIGLWPKTFVSQEYSCSHFRDRLLDLFHAGFKSPTPAAAGFGHGS